MEISYADEQTFTALERSSDERGFFSSDCVLVNFLPQLQLPQQRNAEIIFIIDQSGGSTLKLTTLLLGSMDGDPINQARQSLLILLKSLPVGCRFQVVGFGSTYSMLFSE